MEFAEASLFVENIYPNKKVGAGVILITDDDRHLTRQEHQLVVDYGKTDALLNNTWPS
ncbi:hypothetical protein [Pectobacterium polaris]|uniref:hypothetical protein n=2 Tax=Pectobacteriaceae TaxID=1903410 RepID=UPI001A9C4710|nr:MULTISPECIES: hypothetical protein [Pectobacterium]